MTQNAAEERAGRKLNTLLLETANTFSLLCARPPTENNASLSVPRFWQQTAKHFYLPSTGGWQGAHQAVHLTNVTCPVTMPHHRSSGKQRDAKATHSLLSRERDVQGWVLAKRRCLLTG